MNNTPFSLKALELVLGVAVQQLLTRIEKERQKDSSFKSILNNLKSTLDTAYPRINEVFQLRESNGLPTGELERLLGQMNEALETVDKCSRVTWWNCCMRRKYMAELLHVDASIRNFFLVNLTIDQYKNTTLIQVQLKDPATFLGCGCFGEIKKQKAPKIERRFTN